MLLAKAGLACALVACGEPLQRLPHVEARHVPVEAGAPEPTPACRAGAGECCLPDGEIVPTCPVITTCNAPSCNRCGEGTYCVRCR